MREGQLFIAVSRFIRERIVSLGYPEEKTRLHYIGVDCGQFSPPSHGAKEPMILNVARHTEKKGIDTLLRAFAVIAPHFPAVNLVQVGTGHLTPALRALAEKLGLKDRVVFLGAQPHSLVVDLMRKARIFALTSRTAPDGDAEGLGIVLNEASASGCALVGTRHGGIPETMIEGETGFLADEEDHRGIAESIAILLGDSAVAARMGSAGREYVVEHFNISRQTEVLEALYDQLLN